MPDRTDEFKLEAARTAPLIRSCSIADAESLLLSCMRLAYSTGRVDGVEDFQINFDKVFPDIGVQS